MSEASFSTRRRFLKLTVLGAVSTAILAACSPAAAPSPTTAPAKPTTASGGTTPATTGGATPTAGGIMPTAAATKPAATTGTTPAAGTTPVAKSSVSGAGVTLRFHSRAGVEDEMIGQILPKFEAQTGAKVTNEVFTGTEYFQKLQTLAAGGTLGDVMHIFTGDSSYQLFFAGGVLIPIDDFVKKENFSFDQYYKYSAEAARLDGKLGGLPFKSHPSRVGLFYNKAMIDKAGLKPPTDDMTLDQQVEYALKLTKSPDQFGFTHPWHDLQYYMLMIRNFGGELYLDEGRKSGFNTPEAQAAFQYIYDLSNKHKVVLNPLQTTPTPNDVFISGKVGLSRQNIGTKAAFRSIKDFEWGMVLAPKGPTGRRGSLAETDLLSISKFSKSQDLAWELMKTLTSKEAGIALASQTGNRSSTPGARPDVYNAPEVMSLPYPKGVQEESLKAMNEVEPYAQAFNFRGQEVLRAIDPLADEILLGKSQPTKEFMNRIHSDVQAILDKPRP